MSLIEQLKTLEKRPSKRQIQLGFYNKLLPSQQQQLIEYIVSIMLTPMPHSKINTFSQKFRQVQHQTISIVQKRVQLQFTLIIAKIKQQHFQTVCQLYDSIKARDEAVNYLANKNAQLDEKYLAKVAQLSQLRLSLQSLQNENNQLKIILERVSQIDQQVPAQRKNEISSISKQIISLKQTFTQFFDSWNSSPESGRQFYLKLNQSFESQEKLPKSNGTKTQEEFVKTLETLEYLKCTLCLRLDMAEYSSKVNDQYQESQQLLIERLFDELMRQKKLKEKKIQVDLFANLAKEIVQNIKDINNQYSASTLSINSQFERELIRIKQQLEELKEQNLKNCQLIQMMTSKQLQYQKQIDLKNQSMQQIQHRRQTTQTQLQNQERIQIQNKLSSQLDCQTKIRNIEKELYSIIQEKERMLRICSDKIQKLENNLALAQFKHDEEKQQIINKTQKQINRLMDSIQSLNNENSQTAKQLIDVQSQLAKTSNQLHQADQEKNQLAFLNASIARKLEECQQKFQQSQFKIQSLLFKENQTASNRSSDLTCRNQLEISLKQKWNEINFKQQELNQLKTFYERENLELCLLRQQLYAQKSLINQTKRSVEQSREILQAPPSPHKKPLQTPEEQLSPLNLESSLKKIYLNESSSPILIKPTKVIKFEIKESYKIDIKKNQESKFGDGNRAESICDDMSENKLDEQCRKAVDEWMKNEQKKWNALYFQIDELTQLVLSSQL